jgi:hypothetical protein
MQLIERLKLMEPNNLVSRAWVLLRTFGPH